MGYRRRGLRKTVIIRSENIKKRLRWVKERLNWAPEMWNNYIFSDECSGVIKESTVGVQKMRNIGLT